MIEYFKKLNSVAQFDLDFEKNKALAEAGQLGPHVPDEEDPTGGGETHDSNQGGNQGDNQPEDDTKSPIDKTGQKKPQEVIVEPGVRKKQVSYITTSGGLETWAIVLIAAGGAVLAGGGFTAFMLIRKRRRSLVAGGAADAGAGSPDSGADV